MADLRDQIYAISYGLCGIPANKIPHVMRPAEQIANAHARLKSSEARKRIEETKWEEV